MFWIILENSINTVNKYYLQEFEDILPQLFILFLFFFYKTELYSKYGTF